MTRGASNERLGLELSAAPGKAVNHEPKTENRDEMKNVSSLVTVFGFRFYFLDCSGLRGGGL